jgi:Holliday junction resolvase-like predicted endonuclease
MEVGRVLGDIKFDSVSRNMNNQIGKLQDEYDLVLMNGNVLAIIEVKAKAHVNDLEKMITKKVVNFPKLFHAYQHYHLYAGVATLVTNNDLIEKAQELGLFLLTQQGDHTAIVQTGRLLH